jgi:hypothetical protein
MSIPPPWPACRAFFGTPPVIEPSAGQLSGDAEPVGASLRGGPSPAAWLVVACFVQRADAPES